MVKGGGRAHVNERGSTQMASQLRKFWSIHLAPSVLTWFAVCLDSVKSVNF